jgi:hypothetical protein
VTENLLFASTPLLVPVSQDGENEAGGTGTPTAIMHGEEERRGEERYAVGLRPVERCWCVDSAVRAADAPLV